MEETRYFEAIEQGDVSTLGRVLAETPGLLEARTAPSCGPKRQLDCTGLHAAEPEDGEPKLYAEVAARLAERMGT